jgi:hypothetical protein
MDHGEGRGQGASTGRPSCAPVWVQHEHQKRSRLRSRICRMSAIGGVLASVVAFGAPAASATAAAAVVNQASSPPTFEGMAPAEAWAKLHPQGGGPVIVSHYTDGTGESELQALQQTTPAAVKYLTKPQIVELSSVHVGGHWDASLLLAVPPVGAGPSAAANSNPCGDANLCDYLTIQFTGSEWIDQMNVNVSIILSAYHDDNTQTIWNWTRETFQGNDNPQYPFGPGQMHPWDIAACNPPGGTSAYNAPPAIVYWNEACGSGSWPPIEFGCCGIPFGIGFIVNESESITTNFIAQETILDNATGNQVATRTDYGCGGMLEQAFTGITSGFYEQWVC